MGRIVATGASRSRTVTVSPRRTVRRYSLRRAFRSAMRKHFMTFESGNAGLLGHRRSTQHMINDLAYIAGSSGKTLTTALSRLVISTGSPVASSLLSRFARQWGPFASAGEWDEYTLLPSRPETAIDDGEEPEVA